MTVMRNSSHLRLERSNPRERGEAHHYGALLHTELWSVPTLGRRAGTRRLRGDVLVDPEQVRRVVAALDLHQALVVGAVALAHTPGALVSLEEVDVGAARGVRVDRVVVPARPVAD